MLILTMASLVAEASPLTIRQGRPFVDGVYVNGSGPYRFLIDTGAESNQMDARLAQRLGLRAAYQVDVVSVTGMRRAGGAAGVQVRLGDAEASGEMLFTGLEQVRELAPDTQGVLGQAFLRNFDYRLSLRERRIEIGYRDCAGMRVEMERDGAVPVVFTSAGRFIVDSGTDRPVLFGHHAERLYIEGSEVKLAGAHRVAKGGRMGVSGLLPASSFGAIYFCNSRGYMVFE